MVNRHGGSSDLKLPREAENAQTNLLGWLRQSVSTPPLACVCPDIRAKTAMIKRIKGTTVFCDWHALSRRIYEMGRANFQDQNGR